MTVAYVVLCHRDPEHLSRLGRSLDDAPVVLHVDARVDDPLVSALYDAFPSAVRAERRATRWASWDLVLAAIRSMRTAFDLNPDASHVALLSGQDYLLASTTTIDDFFRSRPDQSWCAGALLPRPYVDDDGGFSRFTSWHRPVMGRRVRIPVRRRLPDGVVPKHGEQWCVVARTAFDHLWSLHVTRPELSRFFRRTWIPDELYVPTLMEMSPAAGTIVNRSLWLTRWEGGSHPQVLNEQDVEQIVAAASPDRRLADPPMPKLFARKLDSSLSGDLVVKLDDRLGILSR